MKNIILRLFYFVVFADDDSAFYGVHRIDKLRQCRFTGYFPPNRSIISNFCYLILFDILLFGRICLVVMRLGFVRIIHQNFIKMLRLEESETN